MGPQFKRLWSQVNKFSFKSNYNSLKEHLQTLILLCHLIPVFGSTIAIVNSLSSRSNTYGLNVNTIFLYLRVASSPFQFPNREYYIIIF